MSKFCSNCGKELDESAIVCVKCGTATDKLQQKKSKQPGKGLSIASMVLGIIAIFYGFFMTVGTIAICGTGEFYYFPELMAATMSLIFFPSILSVIGLSLGIASTSKVKNGFNISGIILNSITILLCVLSIIIMLSI